MGHEKAQQLEIPSMHRNLQQNNRVITEII